MSEQLQLRRGPASALANFIGAQGEIVADTTNNRLVYCDGATIGGWPLAKLTEISSGSPTPNILINGAMSIDTRNSGASGTAIGYTLDQWEYLASQTGKFTWGQNLGAIAPPPGFTHYFGFQSSSSFTPAAGDYFSFAQPIEANNIYNTQFGTGGAKALSLSFLAYSSMTGTFSGVLQNFAQTRSYPFTFTIGAANTWTPISVQIPGDTAGTWVLDGAAGGMLVSWCLGAGSTFLGAGGAWAASNFAGASGSVSLVSNSGAIFYLTTAKLEIGAIATGWPYRQYSDEMVACQRYYRRIGGQVFADVLLSGYATAGASVSTTLGFAPMRAAPTVSFKGTWINANLSASYTYPSKTSVGWQITSVASAVVASYSNGGYLELSAVL